MDSDITQEEVADPPCRRVRRGDAVVRHLPTPEHTVECGPNEVLKHCTCVPDTSSLQFTLLRLIDQVSHNRVDPL